MRPFTLICFIVSLFFVATCTDSSSGEQAPISADSALVAVGQTLFEKNCSACHNFSRDGIGPSLDGITGKVSIGWLGEFIKDPSHMISLEDKRAVELQKKFRTIMPSFSSWKNDELLAVISYLNTKKKVDSVDSANDDKKIQNPVVEKIKLSTIQVKLFPVLQFPPSSDGGKLPLTRITKLDFQPGTGILFVNDLRGKFYKLENGKAMVYMDLKKIFPAFTDAPGLATGFGSFAFHPDYVNNGIFYTTHTELPDAGRPDFHYADSIKVTVQWVLTEWKTKKSATDEFDGTRRELMRVNMVSGAHGVQEISFNSTAKRGDGDYGLLYMGIGDGASVQEGYSFIPHSKKSVWGTIIRINPFGNNSVNGKYGIPSYNPFVHDNDPNTVKEIYAYGFRNPHRISWIKTGDMLVSNIGQANIEAIDLVKPGKDYGWPIREGQFVFNPEANFNNVYPLPDNDSIYKITYPVAVFDHDEGNAIAGGYEYVGKTIPELKGKFLFGDIPSGRLFYIDISGIKQGSLSVVHEWTITIDNSPKTLRQICNCDRVDLHFGKDAQGELYILTKADGRLYKIISAKK